MLCLEAGEEVLDVGFVVAEVVGGGGGGVGREKGVLDLFGCLRVGLQEVAGYFS